MTEEAARDEDLLAPVAPEFFVRDLDRSLRFYTDSLGFRTIFEEPDFAVMRLGPAFLLLAAESAVVHHTMPGAKEWLAGAQPGIGVNVRIMVRDVDAVLERARAAGATIAKEIGDREYGLRDFLVADPDGYLLRFASPVAR